MKVRDLTRVPGPALRRCVVQKKYIDAETLYGTLHMQKLPEHARPSSKISSFMEDFLRSKLYPLPEPTYDGTNSDLENVWKSLNKLLVKPQYRWDQKILDRAMELTYRQLSSALEVGPDYNPEFTYDSKPALWWKYYGFNTKQEVLNAPIFWEAYNQCIRGLRDFPPYSVAGKRELLTKDEIAIDKKIRTFVLESMELVVEHHFLWGNQNKQLVELQPGYIRYGINLHNGVFHRMITELWRKFWAMLDVSGWDRKFPFARMCQQLRERGLRTWYARQGEQFPTWLSKRIERANNAYCSPTLLLPTGDVVRIHWGQVSGSVLTTSNNCIGHNILENYKLIMACPTATDEEIVSQGSNLYGDDIDSSYDEKFSRLRDEEFVNEIYSHFGMTVKAGTFKVQDNPIGLSFLGGTCRCFRYNNKLYYIPSYDRMRVLSGLQVSIDKLSSDDELTKAFSLLELGWYDCYDEITSYIRFLFQKCPPSQIKRAFLTKGIPSRQSIMMDWAGLSAGAA